jgi:hypothetical protein
MVLGVALLAAVVLASTASAAMLPRSPQVVFQNGSLQGYLNANDGGINTATDQLNGQYFSSNVGGVAEFELMIELSGNAAFNIIGVYNANDVTPTLLPLFPASATGGYSARCQFFSDGTLKVTLFDPLGGVLGQTTYAGVTRSAFGFYIQGPGGTFYSQDYRNASAAPQALTYAGTDAGGFGNIGDWWECFNDTPYASNLSTFDSAVLLLQSVTPRPVPTLSKSWGSLKATYR